MLPCEQNYIYCALTCIILISMSYRLIYPLSKGHTDADCFEMAFLNTFLKTFLVQESNRHKKCMTANVFLGLVKTAAYLCHFTLYKNKA